MPLPLPNLDDRTYADLIAEARALIPILLPAWTDHNPSDPGITLIELLAWHTEMLLYQVNEIPEAHTVRFLALLNGSGWTRPEGAALDELVGQTMRGLRERYRAVTAEDFEYLARNVWEGSPFIDRVRCVPRRDLSAASAAARGQPAAAHVSVVVVLKAGINQEAAKTLLTSLTEFYEPRRTLTTRHHVVGPSYVAVDVAATLALRQDAAVEAALDHATGALTAFFDPFTSDDRLGWPLGRDVYASEVYAVLDGVSDLDYVEDVRVSSPDRAAVGDDLPLDAHELVRVRQITLNAYDTLGQTHQRVTTIP